MPHLRTSILGITLLISMASLARAEESGDEIAPPGMVKVERLDIIAPKPPKKDYSLLPYAERRGKWGFVMGFEYSTYNPTNYSSAYLAQDFTSIYGTSASSPLIEGQVVFKRNFSFGSVGIEGGGGHYDTSSGNGLVNSDLQFTELRVGGIVILDTLFSQPYVAPYASAGAYTMIWNERMGSSSYRGNTQMAPYFTLGVQASLDWIDKEAAIDAYESGGIQSTFLFFEMRSYFASSAKSDADFSANFVPGGGLRLEF